MDIFGFSPFIVEQSKGKVDALEHGLKTFYDIFTQIYTGKINHKYFVNGVKAYIKDIRQPDEDQTFRYVYRYHNDAPDFERTTTAQEISCTHQELKPLELFEQTYLKPILDHFKQLKKDITFGFMVKDDSGSYKRVMPLKLGLERGKVKFLVRFIDVRGDEKGRIKENIEWIDANETMWDTKIFGKRTRKAECDPPH